MFEGVYSSMYSEPIADMGARKALGMNGSLSGYIHTGNPYNKHYYRKTTARDTFVGKKSKKKFDKLITAGVAGVLALAGLFLLYKKGKLPKINIKLPEIKSLKNIPEKIKSSAKNNKILDKFKSIFKKAPVAKPTVAATAANADSAVSTAAAEAASKVEPVIATTSSQIDKFNKRMQGADLSYVQNRAKNATTHASKKALEQQVNIIQNHK